MDRLENDCLERASNMDCSDYERVSELTIKFMVLVDKIRSHINMFKCKRDKKIFNALIKENPVPLLIGGKHYDTFKGQALNTILLCDRTNVTQLAIVIPFLQHLIPEKGPILLNQDEYSKTLVMHYSQFLERFSQFLERFSHLNNTEMLIPKFVHLNTLVIFYTDEEKKIFRKVDSLCWRMDQSYVTSNNINKLNAKIVQLNNRRLSPYNI